TAVEEGLTSLKRNKDFQKEVGLLYDVYSDGSEVIPYKNTVAIINENDNKVNFHNKVYMEILKKPVKIEGVKSPNYEKMLNESTLEYDDETDKYKSTYKDDSGKEIVLAEFSLTDEDRKGSKKTELNSLNNQVAIRRDYNNKLESTPNKEKGIELTAENFERNVPTYALNRPVVEKNAESTVDLSNVPAYALGEQIESTNVPTKTLDEKPFEYPPISTYVPTSNKSGFSAVANNTIENAVATMPKEDADKAKGFFDILKRGDSSTAKKLGIDNTPTGEVVGNLVNLSLGLVNTQKEISNLFGKAVNFDINSAFRNEATNKAVGGAEHSDHKTGNGVDVNLSNLNKTEKNKALNYLFENQVRLGIRFAKLYEKTGHLHLSFVNKAKGIIGDGVEHIKKNYHENNLEIIQRGIASKNTLPKDDAVILGETTVKHREFVLEAVKSVMPNISFNKEEEILKKTGSVPTLETIKSVISNLTETQAYAIGEKLNNLNSDFARRIEEIMPTVESTVPNYVNNRPTNSALGVNEEYKNSPFEVNINPVKVPVKEAGKFAKKINDKVRKEVAISQSVENPTEE
ncbi:MAG: D-Ala-D-Ala carboxypeptidase family metallohydrolase, partial [Fusobacteriaceae bacterium]